MKIPYFGGEIKASMNIPQQQLDKNKYVIREGSNTSCNKNTCNQPGPVLHLRGKFKILSFENEHFVTLTYLANMNQPKQTVITIHMTNLQRCQTLLTENRADL